VAAARADPVAMIDDAALDALFLPLADGTVAVPRDEGALFLRARAGAWLHAWPRNAFACEQTFKPASDELAQYRVRAASEVDPERRFQLVLALPPRQRDEARALLARAVRHAAQGGIVVACQANAEGARSVEADLARLAGPLRSRSKHKCRVFHTGPLGDAVDAALQEEWLALDALRPILDGRFVSRPGLFAWDRIDAASALLAEHLPETLGGHLADLGAGYGYLASELVRRCPRVESIDLHEAEHRALEPARINLAHAVAASGRTLATDFFWHDVTQGLERRYDAIISNPPFHQGRADQPELGQAFIAAAAAALRDDGEFRLVANRHLPYESILAARFGEVRRIVERDGFKVISARRARR
jgi:16S rRNA (guanine1207-N2)-methyltransferase